MAVSPDGRYVVTVNAGYGTFESQYDQSFAVLDTQTGALADFPDARTGHACASDALLRSRVQPRRQPHLRQHGLAHRSKRRRQRRCGQRHRGLQLRRRKDRARAPDSSARRAACRRAQDATARRIGQATRACRIRRRLRSLARPATKSCWSPTISPTTLFSSTSATGAIEKRFDLSESDAVPSTYPVALAVTSDGKRAFVALWNASEIVELDLTRGTVARKLALLKPPSPIAPGTHPCAFAFSPDEKTLYVALANRDAVAAVNVSCGPVSA